MNDSRKIYGSNERCTTAFDLVSFVCPGNTWTDWMDVRMISTPSAIESRDRRTRLVQYSEDVIAKQFHQFIKNEQNGIKSQTNSYLL